MNEELLKRLDVLAAKLGVTAQYLWAVLLKEARVEAIADGCVGLLLAAVTAFLIRLSVRGFSDYYDDSDTNAASAVGGTIASIVAGFISVLFLYASITEAINPEYFALTQILKAMK